MDSQANRCTKKKVLIRVWRIVLFVTSIGLLPIAGIYLPSGVYSSSPARQNDATARIKPLKINNSTRSLTVSDLKRSGQELRLSVRNDSGKAIAAFKISTASYGITLDFTPDVFRAGTVHVQPLTIPKANDPEDEVSIVAVLFLDQTGEGNPSVVKEMMERRRGERYQYLLLLPLIDRLLMTPKDQLSNGMDVAEKSAMELPESLGSSDSIEFRAGLHDAKQKFLSDLTTAKALQRNTNTSVLDSQLRYFQTNYVNKISKLPE